MCAHECLCGERIEAHSQYMRDYMCIRVSWVRRVCRGPSIDMRDYVCACVYMWHACGVCGCSLAYMGEFVCVEDVCRGGSTVCMRDYESVRVYHACGAHVRFTHVPICATVCVRMWSACRAHSHERMCRGSI